MNIGMRFENWAASPQNYRKCMNGELVEPFKFTDRNISELPVEQKGDYYKSQVLNIAQSRISNYDENNNGKMEFSEYVTEQKNVYEKTFGEKLDLNIKGMLELLKQNFVNADTNKDGAIDDKEMSAVFAYMDGAKDGKLDGTIDYSSAVATNWAHPDIGSVLANLKDFIFGK